MLFIPDNGLLPSLPPFALKFGEFIPRCGDELPIRLPFGAIMFGEFMPMFGLELLRREPFGEFMPRCTFGPICAN